MEPTLRYDRMVEKALRGVVREALAHVADHGLPGEHHFYISFLTTHPGVKIADFLRADYPQEMTIVLQYQFTKLQARDEAFSVSLSFKGIPQTLVVPYDAIISFADPSVNFALQFHVAEERSAPALPPAEGANPAAAKPEGQVISLDQFRKK